MKEMKNAYNGDVYTFEYKFNPREAITCKIPTPSGNQKCVKSIYWSASDDITLTATMSKNIDSIHAVWEIVKPNAALSPMVTAIKFNNPTNFYRYLHLWVVME